MKKWYICRPGSAGITVPQSCTPIGIAFQKTHGDAAANVGFYSVSDFERWLVKKGCVAYSDGYSHLLKGQAQLNKLPILYPD